MYNSNFTKLITFIGVIFSLNLFNYPVMSQEYFVGEIRMFGSNYCPRDWAETDGQLLPIDQYVNLFSLLGTTYGGNGRTTFALPDLRGRAPISQGQGAGLLNYQQGQSGGVEKIPPPSSFKVDVMLSEEDSVTAIGELGPESQDNRQPYLTMRYCIALEGIYPSRN